MQSPGNAVERFVPGQVVRAANRDDFTILHGAALCPIEPWPPLSYVSPPGAFQDRPRRGDR